MQLRMVRDDGAEMVFHGEDHDGWSIPSGGLQDFLSLPLSISTSANVLTDGSTLVSKRVDECERDVSVVYDGDGDPRAVRDEALSFFNPKHSFEAHVEYLGVTRWCECELADVLFRINDESWPCVGDFTLLCLDPYMRGEDIHDETMQDASGMFTFPFMCFKPSHEHPSGCVASFRVYDGLNTVYNDGGIPAPFRIRAEFSADVKNPTFHTNGNFVKVVNVFEDGQELVIDFMAAPPKVEIDGENAIQMCSRDSVFVGQVLNVGANRFWYDAESGDVNTMKVSIVYYERYMGV